MCTKLFLILFAVVQEEWSASILYCWHLSRPEDAQEAGKHKQACASFTNHHMTIKFLPFLFGLLTTLAAPTAAARFARFAGG